MQYTHHLLLLCLCKILAISVQRKVFTPLGFEKICGKLSFPIILDVEHYLHLPVSQGSKYELHSVVVHQGSHVGGHFVAARKIPSANGKATYLITHEACVCRY